MSHEARGTQDKLTVPDDAPVELAAPPPVEAPRAVSCDEAADGWAALREALDAVERAALSLALRGDTAGVKALANANGVMLEVLADGINEKAADLVGDNILSLDDGISIYDDYRDKIAAMAETGRGLSNPSRV